MIFHGNFRSSSASSAKRCASVDRMVTLDLCRALIDIPQLGLATAISSDREPVGQVSGFIPFCSRPARILIHTVNEFRVVQPQ